MGDNTYPAKILHLQLNLGNNEVLTSASIALLNSSSSLSKIHLYFSNSSTMFVVCYRVNAQ